jgi:hypothetical protein
MAVDPNIALWCLCFMVTMFVMLMLGELGLAIFALLIVYIVLQVEGS